MSRENAPAGEIGATNTVVDPLVVVDNFLPHELATSMRADIDAHFSAPFKHRPETHQVWNYWFVPQAYTYLRTQPERVINRGNLERFLNTLRAWSSETLGLARISWPYLSLYISGCRQGLHNDTKNGRFGFVYSLTRDDRRSTGGETLVLKHGDPFLRNLRKASAGTAFYELVEPRFNRLVLFDDRMVHGVQLVEGSMDPVEGRLVLHGHIAESPPFVAGALPPERVLQGLRSALEFFAAECAQPASRHEGPFVLRFKIAPEGHVCGHRVVLDRVFTESEGDAGWDSIKGRLVEFVRVIVFPRSDGETVVTLPLMLGGTPSPGAVKTPQP